MKEKLNWGLLSKYRTEIYGIATLMIMVFHCQVIIPLSGVINFINSHLNYGVDIFLIMSGICIYFSFSKDQNYIRFMKKRFDRTLIPYLVITPFFWIWKDLIAELDILDFVYNITGLSLILSRENNYLVIGKPQIWYVAFILAMYAVYPIIYKALFTVTEKQKNKNFVLLITIIVALIIFLQYYVPETYKLLEVSVTRTPAFIIGCYLGKQVKENKPFKIYDFLLFFSFIPIKILHTLFVKTETAKNILSFRYLGIFGSFLIIFVAIAFLIITDRIKFIKVPLNKILCFFGNLSLEIYMIHVFIYNAFIYYIPDIRKSDIFTFRQKVLIYAGILVISVILAVIFNKGIGAVKGIIKAKKEKKA